MVNPADIQRVIDELKCAICGEPVSPTEENAREYLAKANDKGQDVDGLLKQWGGACDRCKLRGTVEAMPR